MCRAWGEGTGQAQDSPGPRCISGPGKASHPKPGGPRRLGDPSWALAEAPASRPSRFGGRIWSFPQGFCPSGLTALSLPGPSTALLLSPEEEQGQTWWAGGSTAMAGPPRWGCGAGLHPALDLQTPWPPRALVCSTHPAPRQPGVRENCPRGPGCPGPSCCTQQETRNQDHLRKSWTPLREASRWARGQWAQSQGQAGHLAGAVAQETSAL